MSYSLIVYCVPTGSIQKTGGSNDEILLAEMKSKYAEALRDNDEFFEEDEEDFDDESSTSGGGVFGFLGKLLGKGNAPAQMPSGAYPTSEQILEALIRGEEIDPRCGSKAAYVFEQVCRHLGEQMAGDAFFSLRRSDQWFKSVSKVIEKGGLKSNQFSFSDHLQNRGPIIDLPAPDDFPGMGYLTFEEARVAAPLLSAPAIDEAAKKDENAEYMVMAVGDIRNWLKCCVDRQGDLVAFYY